MAFSLVNKGIKSMSTSITALGNGKHDSWVCWKCLGRRQNPFVRYSTYNLSRSQAPGLARKHVVPCQWISDASTSHDGRSHGFFLRNSYLRGRTPRLLLAVLGIGLLWNNSDKMRHGFTAVRRTLRVISALAICVAE